MLTKIVFATHNKNKSREARAIIGHAAFELLDLEDLQCTAEIEETGSTFEENALIKSRFVLDTYGFDCFSDDSGLEIPALQGQPGVYSARYADMQGSPLNNMELVLQKMKDITDREACFKTVICLIADGEIHFFEGRSDGVITEKPIGTNGFGYDPIFIPNGYDRTFAELTAAEKNTISHRAKALHKLTIHLKKHYGKGSGNNL